MKILTVLFGQLAFAAVAVAQSNHLVTYSNSLDPETSVTAYAQLAGPSFGTYVLLSAPHQDAGFNFNQASVVQTGTLDANGDALIEWDIVGLQFLPATYSLDVIAKIAPPGASAGKFKLAGRKTNTGNLPLTGVQDCVLLDPNYTIGPVEPAPGQWLTDEWDPIGFDISAVNNNAGHPNKVIIYDSNDIDGEDPDLKVDLGNLMIIAQDDIDLDNDGLVDEPNDEQDGGVMSFRFSRPSAFCGITMVDIDEPGTRLLFTFSGGSQTVIPVPPMADGSVQTLNFHLTEVLSLDVFFGGSGAVASMNFLPCPQVLLVGESMTGVPLHHPAGLWITDQLEASMQVIISAENNNSEHPHKAIVFDTDDPTGFDTDLQTPGDGEGNNKRLGKVLIIPEDDVDANNDTLVDDPDDEELGGVLTFRFKTDIEFLGALLLDIDEEESASLVLLREDDSLVGTVNAVNLGDNSVQSVLPAAPMKGVRAVQVHFSSSGALSQLRWCLDV